MTRPLAIITPTDSPCAFCAYLTGERPYTILFRDSTVAVLVTREQRGRPHVLVVPIRHVTTLLEVTDAEATGLAICVRQAAKAIDQAYKGAGISVWQNNGVSAGQAIGHVHFHVAGTLDRGGTDWGEVPELSLDATADIARRLEPYFHL